MEEPAAVANGTLTLLNLNITNGFVWKSVEWNWWVICQALLAVVGLLGNTVAVLVYSIRSQFDKSTCFLIKALAVADFVSSISFIPLRTAATVPDNFMGHLYCKFIFPNVTLWLSVVASIFTLTAISVERYLAVVHPIKYRKYFSNTHPQIVVLSIWLSSGVINSCSLFISHRDPETGECFVSFGTSFIQHVIGIFLFLVEYFLPVLIMISTQVITIKHLYIEDKTTSHDGMTRGTSSNSTVRQTRFVFKARKKIVRMLCVVILIFVICWTPDQLALITFHLGLTEPQYLAGDVYRIFVVLAFCNSCANPFIYAVSNPQFRETLRQILTRQAQSIGLTIGSTQSTPPNDATPSRNELSTV